MGWITMSERELQRVELPGDVLNDRSAVQYSRHSLGEVAMICHRQFIGRILHARRLSAQTIEVTPGCKVMVSLGRPAFRKFA